VTSSSAADSVVVNWSFSVTTLSAGNWSAGSWSVWIKVSTSWSGRTLQLGRDRSGTTVGVMRLLGEVMLYFSLVKGEGGRLSFAGLR
jgi:hypothetical protein